MGGPRIIFAVADLSALYNVVSVAQSLYVARETVFLPRRV